MVLATQMWLICTEAGYVPPRRLRLGGARLGGWMSQTRTLQVLATHCDRQLPEPRDGYVFARTNTYLPGMAVGGAPSRLRLD